MPFCEADLPLLRAARVGGPGQAARVIRRTFQLVPGIGPWREKDLWARGLESWDAVRAGGGGVLGRTLHDALCAAIDARGGGARRRRPRGAGADASGPRALATLAADRRRGALSRHRGGRGGGAAPTHGRRLPRRGRAGDASSTAGTWMRCPARLAAPTGLGDLQRRRVRSSGPPARVLRAAPAGAPPGPRSRSAGASVSAAGSSRPRTGWASPVRRTCAAGAGWTRCCSGARTTRRATWRPCASSSSTTSTTRSSSGPSRTTPSTAPPSDSTGRDRVAALGPRCGALRPEPAAARGRVRRMQTGPARKPSAACGL